MMNDVLKLVTASSKSYFDPLKWLLRPLRQSGRRAILEAKPAIASLTLLLALFFLLLQEETRIEALLAVLLRTIAKFALQI